MGPIFTPHCWVLMQGRDSQAEVKAQRLVRIERQQSTSHHPR